MQELRNICDEKTRDLAKSIHESTVREQMALERRGHTLPNEHGNRKARRAARAITRRELVSC